MEDKRIANKKTRPPSSTSISILANDAALTPPRRDLMSSFSVLSCALSSTAGAAPRWRNISGLERANTTAFNAHLGGLQFASRPDRIQRQLAISPEFTSFRLV